MGLRFVSSTRQELLLILFPVRIWRGPWRKPVLGIKYIYTFWDLEFAWNVIVTQLSVNICIIEAEVIAPYAFSHNPRVSSRIGTLEKRMADTYSLLEMINTDVDGTSCRWVKLDMFNVDLTNSEDMRSARFIHLQMSEPTCALLK